MTVTASMTQSGEYILAVDLPDSPTEQTHTLTVTNGTGDGSYEAGVQVPIIADAAPEGKQFDQWTTNNGGTFVDASSASTMFTMPAGDVTVTATYKNTTTPPVQTYALTVINGTGSGNYEAGTKVPIVADAAPEDKRFDKWSTDNGGAFADSSSASTTFTMPAGNVAVIATYKDVDTPPEPNIFTITFDYVNGTIKPTTISTDLTGKVPSLPTPTRDGYTFDGWYMTDGTRVTTNTVFTADTTVYARWSKIDIPSTPSYSGSSSDSDPSYSITIPTRITGGTVKVTPTSASENQRVTIITKPNYGYTLEKLTVTDSKGNELDLTDQGEGKYTFRMPEGKVLVNAISPKSIT